MPREFKDPNDFTPELAFVYRVMRKARSADIDPDLRSKITEATLPLVQLLEEAVALAAKKGKES